MAARGQPCRLDQCGAACCVGGIWIDVGHVQTILDVATQVAAHMDADRRDPGQWFTDEVVEHCDFPSGIATATAVRPRPGQPDRPGCVFVRADHTCALQVAGHSLGLGWPGLKPFDCATFPVLMSEGSLRWDRQSASRAHGADCQIPRPREPALPDQPPFFRVFRREIELAIGRAGYATLDCAQLRRRAKKPTKSQNPTEL